MSKGKLYGVGVGPGDPELMTIKAVNTLKRADVIALPDKGAGEKTAMAISKEYIRGKELLSCHIPMVRDRALLEKKYRAAADDICLALDKGQDVAFITLGDPTVYSTYIYIHRIVDDRGYECEIIPGITSFCAAAARVGESLCTGDKPLVIVPASGEHTEQCMKLKGTKVIMKAGSRMDMVADLLRRNGLEDVVAVENCTMNDERIIQGVDGLGEDVGYFALVIAKEKV